MTASIRAVAPAYVSLSTRAWREMYCMSLPLAQSASRITRRGEPGTRARAREAAAMHDGGASIAFTFDHDAFIPLIEAQRSSVELVDEDGNRSAYVQGSGDTAGTEFVQFSMTGLQISAEHDYLLRLKIAMPAAGKTATGTFPMPTEV